ncbi:mucin-associated surface protein (MASP), partial [Trypanosoma cruzi]
MAMMMAGRVLLGCALCVLWCGAGGRCKEEAGSPAGGKGAVETTGASASGQDSSDLKKVLPKANQSTETPAGKSLEGKEVNTDQLVVVPGVEDEEDGNPSEQLEEPVEDGPDQEKTKPKLQNKEQEVTQPSQAQVDLPQKAQPLLQQSQPLPPSAPQPHTPASEEG